MTAPGCDHPRAQRGERKAIWEARAASRLMRCRGSLCVAFGILISLGAACAKPATSVRALPPVEEALPRIEVQEFVLGPRDEVEVFVWQHADLSRTTVVNPAGFVSYPLVGTLKASGLTGEEVATRIREGLARYLVDPQVSVTVKSVRSQKVFVLGEVNRPGVFPLEGPMRAVEAIALAGGFNLDAETQSVLLIRGDLRQPELHTLPLDRTLFQGAVAENVQVQPGDIIYVPAMRIADTERFFRRISNIILPVVALLQGILFFPR